MPNSSSESQIRREFEFESGVDLSHYRYLVPAQNLKFGVNLNIQIRGEFETSPLPSSSSKTEMRGEFDFKFGLNLSPSRESSSKSQIRREFEFGFGVNLSHYWDVIPA